MLCLMAKNGYAATFDLQPYTSCSLGVCATSLDVSTLGLSQNKINALKTVNITNFLTKSGVINNFAYSWSGNVVTITGNVNNNVYWQFGAGGDVYDPWWNVSSYYNYTYPNLPFSYAGCGTTNKLGYLYTPNQTVSLCSVTKTDSTNATKLWLNSTSANFVGNTSTFTPCSVLTAGTLYSIALDAGGASYCRGYDPATTNPTLFKYGTLNWFDGAFMYNIAYLYLQLTSSTYYTFSLTLNGTSANVTLTNGTMLNTSIITNLTNINSSIYVNGTIYNASVGNVTNRTILAPGIWNITAGSNNSDSVTYWATITLPGASAAASNITIAWNVNMNDAPGICLADNVTFQRQTNISYGSTYQTLTENYTCPYGCSANTCNYPTWINSIITLVIVGAALFLIYKVV